MTVKFRAKGKGRARPKQNKGALTVNEWRKLRSGGTPATKGKSKEELHSPRR